jgi:hypothetical protein
MKEGSMKGFSSAISGMYGSIDGRKIEQFGVSVQMR